MPNMVSQCFDIAAVLHSTMHSDISAPPSDTPFFFNGVSSVRYTVIENLMQPTDPKESFSA